MLRWRASAVSLTVIAVVSACGGGGQAATPTPATTSVATATAAAATTIASATATAASTSSAAPIPSGEAALVGPDVVPAGAKFEVTWTGPNAPDDYVTLVKVGTTKWTDEQYFYTRSGSTGTLVAPIESGAYEVWYVNGADDATKARRPITVTPFAGTLEAPAEAQAGSEFEVSWTGPDGPSDYVTIVKVGAAKWTTEPYFYTANGRTGKLVAPVALGAYEVWYVTGQDPAPQVRRPITVTGVAITLEAPASVKAGADFQVKWTGPNRPQDYVTIVPAGSPEGTYLDYAYTASANPVTLTAPAGTGNYEIWYASDRVKGTFASRPIVVE